MKTNAAGSHTHDLPQVDAAIAAAMGVTTSLKPSGGDDTNTILNAMLAAPAGSTLRFAAGAFNISAPIPITKRLRFVSDGAVLKVMSSAGYGCAIFKVTAPDVEVEGFEFNPNGDVVGGTRCIVVATGALRTRVHHNLFTNPNEGGLYVTGAPEGIYFEHNAINGKGYGVLTINSTFKGLHIESNDFKGGVSGDAIELNEPLSGGDGFSILGNHIKGYTFTGAGGFGIGVAQCVNGVISNNVISDCYEGIHIEDDSANIVVGNNNISKCRSTGIALISEVGQKLRNIVVNANVVSGCAITHGISEAGISVENNGYKEAITISNNIVDGNDTSGIGAAVDCHDLIVSDNTSRGNWGMGINLGAGIYRPIVSGNRCGDGGRGHQDYGLRLGGVIADALVMGNNFQGNILGAVLESNLQGSPIYLANKGWP